MKRLLVVYHSQSGRTARLAEAVRAGARLESGVDTILVLAAEADAALLCSADAVLFGSPENFGDMAGALKDFFDRTYYAVLARQLNLPYAQFISAGNDGRGAVQRMDRILAGYPMRKVQAAVIVRGDPDAAALAACGELGQAMAAGLAMGIF